MKKVFVILAGVFSAMFAFISNSFADMYTLSGSTTTALGGAATDTANSLVGVLASLIPVFIPLIVVGFVIAFIRSFISKRG